MFASDNDDLEEKLLKASEKLHDPLPSSIPCLLRILDKLFLCLGEVKQDPPWSIEEALSPLKIALVAESLFNHSNLHVRVSVASCIIEIMRITAPVAPYDDDKMQEVFRLVVSSFEHLADESCLSYTKRTSMIETVAMARVPLVMLDLGCDALFIDMFQHFLEGLRDHHPVKVSSCMENIMTLVLEESEDIPLGLLSPILRYLKKDDKILQVSRRLAERVLTNCASKLKTSLNEAVKSSGISLDKYSHVVASICEVTGTHKVAEVSTPEQTDAQTHKKARVESCSVTHQLDKVKQSIVDTITSVRQFRSELKEKEDNLEASLLEVDILGEKILGINKILNS